MLRVLVKRATEMYLEWWMLQESIFKELPAEEYLMENWLTYDYNKRMIRGVEWMRIPNWMSERKESTLLTGLPSD